MEQLLRNVDRISIWSGRGFSFLYLISMLVIVYDIVMRSIFDRPTVWAFEAVIFAGGAAYVIGGAYTLCKDSHVRMDVLVSRFSPRTQSALDLVTFPFFLLFVGVILWKGWVVGSYSLLLKETTGTPWNPPIYPLKLLIPLSALLMLLQGLAKFLRDLRVVVMRKGLS